jgi:hypothetical protein
MQANKKKPNVKTKPPRRRIAEILADEISSGGEKKCSVYKAKQIIKIMDNAPELMPHIISGQLTIAECFRAINPKREADPEPEDFEKQVERSFRG